MRTHRLTILALAVASACGRAAEHTTHEVAVTPSGELHTVHMRTVPAMLDAHGTAEPVAAATLSTKLMGSVLVVHVREGDRVRRGDVLLELDARDLDAKAAQVEASLAEAQAVLREATLHAERMRMLFAEEAAPKAQLDAAETALARAQAGVDGAHAAAAELRATRDYAIVRAPFDATVTRRMVDPGAFAAPGAPLLTVQDTRRLRVTVTAPPDAVRGLARGERILGTIEGVPIEATIEGLVPAAGSLYAVNALVDNASATHLAGSAATLAIPVGTREALFVPLAAIHRQGDLTGVWAATGEDVVLRWIRLGAVSGDEIEVLGGLRDGDRILVPAATTGVS